jgi:hypothetical protein
MVSHHSLQLGFLLVIPSDEDCGAEITLRLVLSHLSAPPR